MTLQEAKDQVARKYNISSGQPYSDWEQMEFTIKYKGYGFDALAERLTMAAELYGRSKWEEACEEQKQSCLYVTSLDGDFQRSKIANAPKPEFKP